METSIQIENANEYQKKGQNAILAIQAIQVVDEATNMKMGDILSKVKFGMKAIEEKINVPIEQANSLHKLLTGVRKKILAPWQEAEAIAKKQMADYQYKLMVAKREAEQKAEAERLRLEAEQRKKAEAAAKAGNAKKAEQILAKPVEVKTVVPEVPKTEKQTAVFEYGWEVSDEKLIPDEFWVLDTSKISAHVRREKLECKIPGIKVIESAGIRSR